MKLIGRFKLFLHENSILYFKSLEYSLIDTDCIRFYFCLIKQKSLLWYRGSSTYAVFDTLVKQLCKQKIVQAEE